MSPLVCFAFLKIYFMGIGVLPACLDPLELELQTSMSFMWVLGIEPGPLEEQPLLWSHLSSPPPASFTSPSPTVFPSLRYTKHAGLELTVAWGGLTYCHPDN